MKCSRCGLEKEEIRAQRIVFMGSNSEKNWDISICRDCKDELEHKIWGQDKK
jgi:hypothetical protein